MQPPCTCKGMGELNADLRNTLHMQRRRANTHASTLHKQGHGKKNSVDLRDTLHKQRRRTLPMQTPCTSKEMGKLTANLHDILHKQRCWKAAHATTPHKVRSGHRHLAMPPKGQQWVGTDGLAHEGVPPTRDR